MNSYCQVGGREGGRKGSEGGREGGREREGKREGEREGWKEGDRLVLTPLLGLKAEVEMSCGSSHDLAGDQGRNVNLMDSDRELHSTAQSSHYGRHY